MPLPHFNPINEQNYYEPTYACEICKKSNIISASKVYYHFFKKQYLCNKHILQLERKEKIEKICQSKKL